MFLIHPATIVTNGCCQLIHLHDYFINDTVSTSYRSSAAPFKRNDMEEVCLGYFSFLEHSTRASNWNRSFPLRPNVFDRFFDSLREQCLFIARCPTPEQPRVYGCSVQRVTGCSDIYRHWCSKKKLEPR